jgi:hypothetical protein
MISMDFLKLSGRTTAQVNGRTNYWIASLDRMGRPSSVISIYSIFCNLINKLCRSYSLWYLRRREKLQFFLDYVSTNISVVSSSK